MKFLTSRTVFAGFIANIFVMLGLVWISVKRVQLEAETQQLTESLNQSVFNLQRLHSEINAIQNYANGYALNGNLEYFSLANKLIFSAQDHIESLAEELKDSGEQETSLKSLEVSAGRIIAYHSALMERRRFKDVLVEMADSTVGANVRLNNSFTAEIKKMIEREKGNFEEDRLLKKSTAGKLRAAFYIFSSIAFLLLLTVLVILRQYLKIRKTQEKKIVENEMLLQSITDNTSSPIFIKEISGKYILTNKQFEFLFRGKTDHVKGKTDYQIFPKEIADGRRDKDLEIFKTGEEMRYEEIIPHYDGKIHTYLTVKFPIRNKEGGIYAIGGISTDITESKTNADIVRDSEEQVRTIFESAPDAIIVIDEESRILQWNRKSEELFQWKAEEVIGKPLYEVIMPPKFKERHLKGIQEFIRSGKGPLINRTVEDVALRKDGAEVDIELTLSASHIKEKNIFISFIREITKRKQLEKDNTQVKNFLDSVIDNIPDMIFVKDANELRFVRMNKAGEKLLGISQTELLGKNDYDFFPAEQADFFTEKDRIVLEKEEAVDIPEEVVDTKQGKKWLHTKKIALKDENGKPAYLLGISEDISERKKLENDRNTAFEQLRETEERTTMILENIGDAVIATDENLIVTFMNPVAESLTKWTAIDARGKHIDEIFKIVNEFTRNKVDNPIVRAIEEKRIVDLARDTILIRKDGTEIYINDTGSPIYDRAGNVTGAVLIFSDITEQRLSEKQVEESNKKFEQVFNFSPVPLSISTIDEGKILYVNDAFCKILGFSREEIIGKSSVELKIITDKERENILNYSKQTGGIVKDVETRIKRKDGTTIDVLFSVEILEIDNVPCAVIAFVNISERKNSEQRIRMVLENIGEGVIVADYKQRILLSNHIADEILGINGRYDSSDWTDHYDIFYPDGSIFPAQNLPIEKALKGEISDEVEIVLEDRETKNKKLLKVSGQPIINQDNRIVAAVATLKDITKYKEMEQALEESEMKYRNLIGFRRDNKK